jgi:choline monooxygenase
MKNLDPEFYTDPALYERERQLIFWDTWQLLGPLSYLNLPGDYLATEIAGAQVFVIRDNEGKLRAFRNVCRHRGARLLPEGQGNCKRIRCPYHSWVYGLDGSLERTPWFGDDPKFDPADWPLHEIFVDVWRGLVFVTLGTDCTLESQLAAVIGELALEPIETYQPVAQHRLVFDANWKIYTDNFVEGYHVPSIHPSFFEAIEFEQFETTVHKNMVRMSAPAQDELFYQGRWLWMWPNWTLSVFEGGMNTSRINPLGPARTELIYGFYFCDEKRIDESSCQEVIAQNLAVIEDDFEICVQEAGVHWFQSKLSDLLVVD